MISLNFSFLLAIFLLGLLFLPHRFFGWMELGTWAFQKFAHLIAQGIDCLASFFTAGPLIQNGEALKSTLLDIDSLDKASEIPSLHPYKNFDQLISEVLALRRDWGIPLGQALKNLREQLGRDLIFEKWLRSDLSSLYFQYSFSLLIAWSFQFYLALELDYSLGSSLKAIMMTYQLLGVLLLSFFLKKIRAYYFQKLDRFSAEVEKTAILSPLGGEVTQTLKAINMKSLDDIDGELSHLQKRYFRGLNDWREFGQPMDQLLEDLLTDLKFYREVRLEKVRKKTGFVGLMMMTLFVLPSFFMAFQSLFSQI